jgi:Cu/Ag efflux pump CusA
VKDVGAHVGRAVFGDQVVGINSAELWISIDPKVDYDATVASIQELLDGYTGLVLEPRTYVQQILSQPQQTNQNYDMTLRVYGANMQTLRAQADSLEQTLEGINGVVDPRVILPVEEPTLEIEVDLAAAQAHGIKPGEVRRAAATMLSGILVGNLFEEQKIFDVVVWGTPEIRDSVSDVGNLLIQTADGGQVRLGDVADVRIVASPTVIRHDSMSSYIDVGFNVQEEGVSMAAITRDIKAKLQGYAFPLEYHAEVFNNSASHEASQQRILITGLIALVGIFLLMQASAGSWRLAFANFLVLPAALAGGVLAAFLTNSILSVASLFGLLAVLGIAVRNSLMLIAHCRSLEVEGGQPFGPELVLRGSRDRVVPTLGTALTTAVALLPFAFFGNMPGHEIAGPMALVILGGLITSTFLNLFVMPALYLRYGASREADLEFVTAPAISD